MQTFASILVIAAVAFGDIDWTKITIEPPLVPTPTPAGVDLSGIVLDDPRSTPAAVGIDWSSITLEPPGSYTPAVGQLNSTPVIKGTTSPATASPTQDAPKAAEDSPAGSVGADDASCSVELVGLLLGISIIGLIASGIQIYLLKKLVDKTPPREEMDIEQGRYRTQEVAGTSVKEAVIGS